MRGWLLADNIDLLRISHSKTTWFPFFDSINNLMVKDGSTIMLDGKQYRF